MNYLLIHGAGEDPSVWEGWDGLAIDLQAGLNVPEASLLNYEAAVAADGLLMPRPVCLVGRGLGAVVARLAARRVEPARLVLVDAEPVALRPESELALAEAADVELPEPAVVPTLLVDGPADPQAVAAWARSASASAT